MVVVPNTIDAVQKAQRILYEKAHVTPSHDLKTILWLDKESNIQWVVGYNAWLGRTVQMHVASMAVGKYVPREFTHCVFDYVFNGHDVSIVFGIVNSLNEQAMNFDLRLGFKEKQRWQGMHDDGGDLVLLEMHRDDCRWLRK